MIQKVSCEELKNPKELYAKKLEKAMNNEKN